MTPSSVSRMRDLLADEFEREVASAAMPVLLLDHGQLGAHAFEHRQQLRRARVGDAGVHDRAALLDVDERGAPFAGEGRDRRPGEGGRAARCPPPERAPRGRRLRRRRARRRALRAPAEGRRAPLSRHRPSPLERRSECSSELLVGACERLGGRATLGQIAEGELVRDDSRACDAEQEGRCHRDGPRSFADGVASPRRRARCRARPGRSGALRRSAAAARR